jgi:spermidine synthase
MQVLFQERAMRTAGFVLVFFLSGAAGLAYQMVWAKAFVATIGSEYPAVLAVVTAFMAGMAIGNLLFIKKANLSPKLFGILELIIGAWGAATIVLIPISEKFVRHLLGSNPIPSFHWAIVFAVVTACLLPATSAMGATLAAAERFVTSRRQQHSTGLLYAANTAGAMFGAIVAAFYLMPAFGIRSSLLAFALVNFLCGIAALFFVRGIAPQKSPRKKWESSLLLGSKLFAAGLLGIGLEVVLIRALNHVLENTVYTFAVVLAVYLAGNSLGAFLAQRRIPNRFLRVEILFAALAIASIAVGISLRWAAPIYSVLRNAFGDSLVAVAAAESFVAMIYFLLPTLLMGMLWTLLAEESLLRKPTLAWAVALNTTGAAAAPAIIGLLAIPFAGLKGALAIFPVAYALLAARKKLSIPILVLSLVSLPFLTPARQFIAANGQQIVALHEGVMGSTAVLESANGDRVLKFNNRFQMGGTAARAAEERQAAIPLLLHPNPSRALFIGLGTGITFAAAAHFPAVQAEGVELVPEIARVMPMFNVPAAFDSPQLRTHIADGRRFVRAASSKFDVIVGDLFHPALDSAGFLYTREHFRAIRERLAPDGLFCQWLPLYQMDLASVDTVMATFAAVFQVNEVWLLRLNVDLPVIGLVGRLTPSKYSAQFIENRLAARPELAAYLKGHNLADTIRFLGHYLGPIPSRENLTLNTDWNPVLIFEAPRLTFLRRDQPGERLLTFLSQFQNGAQSILLENDQPLAQRLDRYFQARNVFLRGLQSESQGEAAKAIIAYIESTRITADFTMGYARAIAIATALISENPEQSRNILNALIAARPDLPVAAELLRRMSQ